MINNATLIHWGPWLKIKICEWVQDGAFKYRPCCFEGFLSAREPYCVAFFSLLSLQAGNLGLSNVNFHKAVEKLFVELCASGTPKFAQRNLTAGGNKLIEQESLYSQFKTNQVAFGFLGPLSEPSCK